MASTRTCVIVVPAIGTSPTVNRIRSTCPFSSGIRPTARSGGAVAEPRAHRRRSASCASSVAPTNRSATITATSTATAAEPRSAIRFLVTARSQHLRLPLRCEQVVS
jgi:hypothetical protein